MKRVKYSQNSLSCESGRSQRGIDRVERYPLLKIGILSLISFMGVVTNRPRREMPTTTFLLNALLRRSQKQDNKEPRAYGMTKDFCQKKYRIGLGKSFIESRRIPFRP